MSLEELKQACLKLKIWEEKSFKLNQAPERVELATLTGEINAARDDGLVVSLSRDGLLVHAHCYDPEDD